MKKRILTTAAAILLSVVTFANTGNLEDQMRSKLEQVRSGNESTNFNELGDEFSKIAKKNKNRIEPLYYSAYCYIMNSWQVSETDKKTKILDKAMDKINQAKDLVSDNDELYVLEALYYQAMILVNPVKFGPKYSMVAEELLQKAQAINKDNPRAEFLRAQNLYYRPAQYGGGKEKALPFFEKAAELFNKQNSDNYLQPVWGAKTNKEMLKVCKG